MFPPLVTVYVEKEPRAALNHRSASDAHLDRRALVGPLAVQVQPLRSRAVISDRRAVGIHARNDRKTHRLEERTRRSSPASQELDKPLDEPARHRLARVLLRDHPHRPVLFAQLQTFDRASRKRPTKQADGSSGQASASAKGREPLRRIRRVVAEAKTSLGVSAANHKLSAYQARIEPAPRLTVRGKHLVGPAKSVPPGALMSILDKKLEGRAWLTAYVKGEPLPKTLGADVVRNGKRGAMGPELLNLDPSALEITGNLHSRVFTCPYDAAPWRLQKRQF